MGDKQAPYHCTYCDGPHPEDICPNRCEPRWHADSYSPKPASPASGAAPQLLSDDRLREILNDWCEDKDYSLADVRRDLALAAPAAGKLRDAAEVLLRKLDQVAKDTAGIFAMAHVHGQNYTGANWAEEYEAVRAALEAAAAPPPCECRYGANGVLIFLCDKHRNEGFNCAPRAPQEEPTK